jgi:hypothetical protein
MKRIPIEQFSEAPAAFLEISQTERVVVTEKGKPLAVILGLKYKDEEDYALERDTEFWQMIRERRKSNKGIPLAEAKKLLGLDRPKARKKTAK